MRRLLLVAVVLAVAAAAAPARAEPTGTVTFVSDGPATGTLTLPERAEWDGTDPVLTTRQPGTATAITVSQDSHLTLAAFAVPTTRPVRWDWLQTTLPAGRSTVRMLVTGRTTVTFRVRGIAGNRTVRLTKRLTGATQVVRTVSTRPGNVVADYILFPVRREQVVMHGIVRRYLVRAASADEFCTAPGYAPDCGIEHLRHDRRPEQEHVRTSMLQWDRDDRVGNGYTWSVDAGAVPGTATHVVVVL